MSYKRLGDYIQLVDKRNKDLAVTKVCGLSMEKYFIPSIANTNTVDRSVTVIGLCCSSTGSCDDKGHGIAIVPS